LKKEEAEKILKEFLNELLPEEIKKSRKAKEQVINSLNEYLKFEDDIFYRGESMIKTYNLANIEVRDYKKEEQA
jgi:RNA binding exosome subunit